MMSSNTSVIFYFVPGVLCFIYKNGVPQKQVLADVKATLAPTLNTEKEEGVKKASGYCQNHSLCHMTCTTPQMLSK
jgi:hypothetical protein